MKEDAENANLMNILYAGTFLLPINLFNNKESLLLEATQRPIQEFNKSCLQIVKSTIIYFIFMLKLGMNYLIS